MEENKFQSQYSALIEAKRLEDLSNDKNLLPVYASSTAKILPYQIAAARFALRSDFLKGCILCDEGSLAKTYEALLVAGQKWYEGKENILVVLPPNLVTQWKRKLDRDFTLPYVFWNNTKNIPDEDGIVLTTYDCAIRHADKVKERDWDLAIFDEADVLANYTKDTTVILKNAVREAYKLLLTPTPITKDIRDIYGLIHFIDESILPDVDWFYKRYFRKPENYPELTGWVSQFCFRTLKAQATEYVNFSRRLPITVDYPLIPEEKELYKLISTYITSDDKAAYPEIDEYNLNLLFFKTLSSSPQAFVNMISPAIQRTYGLEKATLLHIQKLASAIKINSKTTQLLKILKTVFNHLKAMKVNQKAIVFVDNNTTLDNLYMIFRQNGYNTLKYKDNDTLEQFRNNEDIQILVTTDTAAKGLDIEYCPVVVNYDMIYNSIQMEQRICRCHRQGQNSDVLVINLLSHENFADVRMLELINKRTLQFNGIFGMSDDIVGNFDTKIKNVLKDLRHRDEVAKAFKENLSTHRKENEQLVENLEDILFTTFTKSIADKITVTPAYIEEKTAEVNNDLWELVKYYNKVKMIYIDPPYNTGNDFVYEDDFKDPMAKYKEVTQQTTKSNPETMGRFHTNWLNMMYPRLRLAANLLRDDGVIFISIDDNEVTNLRRLCDEVFGEENFLAQIVWQKKYAATNDSKGFSTTHDYIVVYQKSSSFNRNLLPRTAEQNKPYKNDDGDGKGYGVRIIFL